MITLKFTNIIFKTYFFSYSCFFHVKLSCKKLGYFTCRKSRNIRDVFSIHNTADFFFWWSQKFFDGFFDLKFNFTRDSSQRIFWKHAFTWKLVNFSPDFIYIWLSLISKNKITYNRWLYPYAKNKNYTIFKKLLKAFFLHIKL